MSWIGDPTWANVQQPCGLEHKPQRQRLWSPLSQHPCWLMTAAQFVKRIDIASVDEDTTDAIYLKVVNVIEVLDQKGDQFFPTPEPTPE